MLQIKYLDEVRKLCLREKQERGISYNIHEDLMVSWTQI